MEGGERTGFSGARREKETPYSRRRETFPA